MALVLAGDLAAIRVFQKRKPIGVYFDAEEKAKNERVLDTLAIYLMLVDTFLVELFGFQRSIFPDI